MGGMFSKPKTVKPPPLPPPAAVPEIEEEEIKPRRRRGRRETFVTGELEPVSIGRKTLLG